MGTPPHRRPAHVRSGRQPRLCRPQRQRVLLQRHKCAYHQVRQVNSAPPAAPGAPRVARAHHKPPRARRRRPWAGSQCRLRQRSEERLLRGGHLSHTPFTRF
ncbi:hypothetical protein NDU88_003629 [Pleurodeles waltl]|uniref:Uncharacterized protein n=1 Tax=Pleurodeles waltl TaxID=8319 RepID=A0AAV7LJF5_PLEWA|nr:hypothetical protein NDU88_003629 [Pleurodeles waltl]